MDALSLAVSALVVLLLIAAAWLAWRRRGAAPGTADDLDAEMREVFLAEARAELVQLQRHLPRWREDPTDLARLQPLRRTFHTLKSAGRMVGAAALGELCEQAERLALRLMEREIPPQAEAVDALFQAASVVPALVEQFAGGAVSPRAASAAAIARIERLLRAARSPARSAALTRD